MEWMSRLAEEFEDDEVKRMREEARKQHGEEAEKKMHDDAVKSAVEFALKARERGEKTTSDKPVDKKDRKESVDEQPEAGVKTKATVSSLRLLYQSCRARILHIAEKISPFRGQEATLNTEFKRFGPPADENWDFRLGDRVRTCLPMHEYKEVQKEVVGWNSNLRVVHGHVGIVNCLRSPFENDIELFFPELYTQCSLYAGVLEKVGEENVSSLPKPNDDDETSRWNVGDFVTTQTDRQLQKIFQTGLPPIPTKCVGKRGQILGVTPSSVLVTFDGVKCRHINASLLIPSTNNTPIVKKVIKHPRGFQIGERLNMTKNLKKLIKNQKGHGGWNSGMCSLRGQEVIVVDIQEDGSLLVHRKHGREWRVNSDSVLKKHEKEKQEGDVVFFPGDVVKIKMPPDIRDILEEAGIPLVFMEYLRLVGSVGDIKEDFSPYVRFGNWRYTELSNELLCQPNYAQTEEYLEAKLKMENLKPGDTVFLDVGPPNLVAMILEEAEIEQSIITALTSCSKLMGYLDNDRAVIQYEDGTRYMVKKRFLSVPERFSIKESKGGIDFNLYRQVQEAIEECVQNAHDVKESSDKDVKVETINIFHGNLPRVDIKINSTIVMHEDVAEWLRKNRKWSVENSDAWQLLVKGHFGKIKVCLFYDGDGREVLKDNGAIEEEEEKIAEEGSSDVGAEPDMDEGPSDEELSQHRCRYLRLFDPRLGQDVYFPYVVHGRQRNPVVEPQQEPEAEMGGENQTFNIINSNVGTVINNP